MKFIKSRFKKIFSLDYRSLALLRIGMGVTLICDLIQRLWYLNAHYTDVGILPRASLLNLWGGQWYVSLHTAFGAWPFELILFIIAFIFAIMMMVGYRTTLATIISWVFLISIHNRNPLILQGGDVIFRVVLFWCMFLPLGKYLSVDSIRRNIKLKSKTYYGASAVAYILQVVIFYFFSGILKTGKEWVSDGTAIYLALSIDQMTTSFGYFLLKFPKAMKVLTFSTVYTEILGALALLSPLWNGPIRTVAVFLLASLQIGINMSMHLGLFGMISIVVTLGLLPSWFWDNCFNKVRNYFKDRSRKILTIYYDQDCGFCTKMVYLIARVLWLPQGVKIIPAQSDENINKEMLVHNSWIVETKDGTHYYKGYALREVFRTSPILFFISYIFYIPGIIQLGNFIYEKIANSRMTVCLPEQEEKPKIFIIRFIKNCFIIFMFLYALAWNFQTMPNHQTIITGSWNRLADITRIDQRFNMFAPYPLLDDGWYVIPGKLSDGREVDLFRSGAPVSYDKPKDVQALYKNQRWQKYMMNLWASDYQKYRLAYGQYLCRDWNNSHNGDETLQTFKIIFMKETTLLNYETPKVEPVTIWDHHCF